MSDNQETCESRRKRKGDKRNDRTDEKVQHVNITEDPLSLTLPSVESVDLPPVYVSDVTEDVTTNTDKSTEEIDTTSNDRIDKLQQIVNDLEKSTEEIEKKMETFYGVFVDEIENATTMTQLAIVKGIVKLLRKINKSQ